MEDTIAAIATAMGEGGIGIVRISGEQSESIMSKIFKGLPKEKVARRMYYGQVINNFTGEIIDEALAVFFCRPYSYTAEDVVEIQCHGSIVSLRKILELVLKNGARIAEPGEFTKRAFLNGRLDLSQAEAVIDLIRSKTDGAFQVALDQLEGRFSNYIKEIRSDLVDCLVNISVNIDYPDEDIEQITFENLVNELCIAKEKIDKLLMTSKTGRILRDGLNVAIIGKPNVGKSSLMNGLLKEHRAIVTEIPGTTRDTIEEMITLKGIPIRLTDTAGIRQTDDIIEKIGIEKSKKSFNEADLVIFLMDRSRPLDNEDEEILQHLHEKNTIFVINKCDLPEVMDLQSVKNRFSNKTFIETSFVDSKGIEIIEEVIETMVYDGKVRQESSLMVTNLRHISLLEDSSKALADGIAMARIRQPLEFLEIDVSKAYESLGLIIGEAVEDDIINEVFARFCLGK